MNEQTSTWSEAIEKIKSTVVFLGTLGDKGKATITATGSILQVQGVFHLLTAKHVVAGPASSARDTVVFFNRKDGTVGRRAIQAIKQNLKVDWVFHRDASVELAIIPFGMDLEADDVLAIPDDLFLEASALHGLDEVSFMSLGTGSAQ